MKLFLNRRFVLLSLLMGLLVFIVLDCRSRMHIKTNSTKGKVVQLTPIKPRPRPALGVHFNFADQPNELIFHMVIPEKRPILAQALKDAGVEDLRMSFHGYYSHISREKTLKLKEETKLTNVFPWFPIELYIAFIKTYHFNTVIAVNVEEGPEVAVDLLKRFEKEDALGLISSVELGNEPFLSARPWTPEEYAQKSAEIIKALRPFKVKFAVALIVGKSPDTPVKLSGDDYCERTLAKLSPLIDLKNSDDIYGAIHLYGRGVTPVAVDQFNSIVRKYSNMKYQVTEYNIRLSLQGNPHLTNAYALEYALKLNRLIMSEDIVGLWVHSFPYHSINYWTDGKTSTVIGFTDSKLQGSDLIPGWHLTPAGKVHYLYQSLAWGGNILAFLEQDDVQYWVSEAAIPGKVVSILNAKDEPLECVVVFENKKIPIQLKAKEIACYQLDSGKQLTSLYLP